MKVLFLIHIDKRWIPQRPHFMALEMKASEGVTELVVGFISAADHRKLLKSTISFEGINEIKLGATPFWHLPIFRRIDAFKLRRAIRKLGDLSQWHVVVTHPRLLPAVEEVSFSSLHYDCMDDASQMAGSSGAYVETLESKLINLASSTSVSSIGLQELLLAKFGVETSLVPNGFNVSARVPRGSFRRDKTSHSAIFFGSLGHWIDQDLLLTLAHSHLVDLHLFGPIDVEIHPDLAARHFGLLPQAELYDFARHCDFGLLPFKQNGFTETIDPVKMYEYVALGLPVLAPRLRALTAFVDLTVEWSNQFTEKTLDELGEVYPRGELSRTRILDEASWNRRTVELLQALQS